MRGKVSEKLTEFLSQLAIGAQEAQSQGVVITPELTRANLEKLAAFIPQGPDIALVKDSQFVLADREIKARIYHPSPDEALPVLLHFHGGGHMCGSLGLYDSASRQLAIAAQAIVITVDYRLSPEFPYPCGIDDCQYALVHYHDLLTDLNHSNTLYIAGDSAGGAICTTLVMNNIQTLQVTIDKQILIYPSVDYTLSAASVEENGAGFLLEKSKVLWYFNAYFGEKYQDDAFIKTASPLYGPMNSSMPDTLIITAGCDPLRDEGNAYASALKKLGVKVTHHQFDDMIHAYMLLQSLVVDECDETYQLIRQFVR